ncbi:MAG: DUF2461 domain-containing protein [Bacteroidetes bacterium]|nr:DUF2461 domain-containing protein [Bacteroidota bacterium]
MSTKILKSSFSFLSALEKNNNREWFKSHKADYDMAKNNISDFADALIIGLNQTDNIATPSGKKSMFRIHRDVRFSKDKTPYNTHWSGAFSRTGKARRGSYYFRIQGNDQSGIGGGFWGPNSDDMALIRSHFAQEPERLRAILNDRTFKKTFGTMQGEQLKSAPRGYSVDHPAIDLLRYKQFFIFRIFSDQEVLKENFYQEALKTLHAIRPFFDYMSEILTTDLNGESLIE